MKNNTIGVFDSGIGGLSVVKHLIQALPYENIIYFGDTARTPYGNKSKETIIQYSIENAVFLLQRNIRALIVACHSASAHAVTTLQGLFNVPVIDVITPCIESAVQASKTKAIAVLGTKATISSGVFRSLIERYDPSTSIIPIACPLFVPLVEEGLIDHEITHMAIQEYLSPLKAHNVDTIILGCTHYPHLSKAIRSFVGEEITIIDPGLACADRVKNLLNDSPNKKAPPGLLTCYASDDPLHFQQQGKTFLSDTLLSVSLKK
jgi:glutamate racemase